AHLDGFLLMGCAVRRRNLIAFWGQRGGDDPLEPAPTRAFFCNLDKPPDQRWAFREPVRATGFTGCAVAVPDERWLFATNDGEVYVVGGGSDGFEAPIAPRRRSVVVKSLRRGKAIAVGPRTAFVRDAPDSWRALGEPPDLPFRDVDGFA